MGDVTGAPRKGDVPLDARRVAAHCGVTVAAVKKWRSRNILPPPADRLGRSDYWWQSTIVAWHATRSAVVVASGDTDTEEQP